MDTGGSTMWNRNIFSEKKKKKKKKRHRWPQKTTPQKTHRRCVQNVWNGDHQILVLFFLILSFFVFLVFLDGLCYEVLMIQCCGATNWNLSLNLVHPGSETLKLSKNLMFFRVEEKFNFMTWSLVQRAGFWPQEAR